MFGRDGAAHLSPCPLAVQSTFFRDVEDLEASCAEAYERGSGGEFRLV